MLQVLDLASRYGRAAALCGVSFEAGPGVCLVTGPNGAGKTTLLRVLAGVLAPSRGTMSLDGADVFSDRAAARRHISYLPDRVPLYADLTVAEHLAYRAQLKGLGGRRLRARLRHVTDAFGLMGFANARTCALSAGQRRLAGLADAFLSDSRLLVLDEPFAGLDDRHALALRAALSAAARHTIVLLATRRLAPLEGLPGGCLVLSSGVVAGGFPLSGDGLGPLGARVSAALAPSADKDGAP